MTEPEPSTYVPVGRPKRRHRWWHLPRLRHRRWWRLVRAVATVLVWAVGTVGITWWWARKPETGVGDVALMAAMAGVVFAAGLIPRGDP